MAYYSIFKRSWRKTVASLQENIIISLLIICPNLVVYNGHAIPKKYRDYAKTVPKQAYKLINAGLQIDYPIDIGEVQMEINKFNLDELYNFEAVDSESSASFPPYIRSTPDDSRSVYSVFSQSSPKYRKCFHSPSRHEYKENTEKKKITRIQSQKLLKSVKNILEKSGFDIHQNSKTSSVLLKLSELLNSGNISF
ncbi:hypothetical protein TVAG_372540 [Trichomonas vaginalis G3]|uniref:Uncharacterized protein n=1 Tax=Trichomonas vaginalis (strain ATCC PRA-98 / G3) TaxID=412133 RepID=A2EYZ7_TRIV3|nr:hypothetical protein TVAGG3_0373250 [Trichomonas vaginalis G3]EAY02109.1 hypothetical protein TVAG_372540 [Trichomonas vaginalis G3]KAI5532749.1 hypothetical protein TVAGG3_0373250 [Trichomonas vaginalis G3]|eukprot:XP_001314501.1 hypothetical protein [Trichomonas vaginalis G3]